MVVGVLIGLIPGYYKFVYFCTVGKINILLSVFLIGMIYPPLITVNYTLKGLSLKLFLILLVQNWLLGPFLMFFLALAILHDFPEYLSGVILVGLARCIAIVLVWIQMVDGDMQNAVSLVAFNSIFQLIFYSLYAQLMINVLFPLFGINFQAVQVSFIQVFESVAIYLGIPFILAIITKVAMRKHKPKEVMRVISYITPVSLLLTILLLFSTQAQKIVQLPLDILLICTPLIIYFLVMYTVSYTMGYYSGLTHAESVVLGFTAASNNFELAIAVSVGVFGQSSKQALAATVGPLIEDSGNDAVGSSDKQDLHVQKVPSGTH
jgi:ACR3 family arsenite transporter